MIYLFDYNYSLFTLGNLYLKTNLFTNIISNFLYQFRHNFINKDYLNGDLATKIFQAKSNNIDYSSMQSEDISSGNEAEIIDNNESNSDYDVLYEKLRDIENTIVKIHNHISDK